LAFLLVKLGPNAPLLIYRYMESIDKKIMNFAIK